MNVRAVLDNLRERGICETVRIAINNNNPWYQKRVYMQKFMSAEAKRKSATAQRDRYQQLLSAYILKDAAMAVGDEQCASKVDAIIVDIERGIAAAANGGQTPLKVGDIRERLKKLETKKTTAYLKSRYLKTVLPQVYDANKGKPVKDVALFLNPRYGLSGSTKLIYDRLKEDGVYEPKLWSMHRIDYPYSEHWIIATEFVRELATAKVCVTHTFHEYFGHLNMRPDTKVVNTWHGCGIIKMLGMSHVGGADAVDKKQFGEYPRFNNYDLVCMPGEGERWIFGDMMGIDPKSPVLQPVGISRTDDFYAPDFMELCKAVQAEVYPQTIGKKILLYAPTYRGPDAKRYAPTELDIRMLKEALSDEWVLVIRHHPTVAGFDSVPEDCKDFAFDESKNKALSTNQWLGLADALISDYSSVAYSYSLFERPIALFLYDYEDYYKNHGMYYTAEDLGEWGQVCMTTGEIVDYITNLDEKFDRERIRKMKQKYMGGCDGHATDRIMEFIYDESHVHRYVY